jgi:hypothetical protein
MDKFREFMKQAADMGLTEKCYILAGVPPMKSVGMASYMAKSVPGMDVPDDLIRRLRGAGKGKAAEEGIKFALEQIAEFKGYEGVHLMAIEWEHKVPEIAEKAGVLPRPAVNYKTEKPGLSLEGDLPGFFCWGSLDPPFLKRSSRRLEPTSLKLCLAQRSCAKVTLVQVRDLNQRCS